MSPSIIHGLGKVVLPNFPLHFANAKLTRRWEFPVLGRDTEAVLRDVVGYDEATIAAHKATGCWSEMGVAWSGRILGGKDFRE